MATASFPASQLTITTDEPRRITLRAQGLLGTEGRRGGVVGMLRRIGAVQLDTISVLARSHELVAYARLGAVGRERIERAYWHPRTASAFEYWSHAACVLPVGEWPYYAFRRREFKARGLRWHLLDAGDVICCAMPLLAGGRLLGRVDPVRRGQTLVADQLTLHTAKAAEPMARALADAAAWAGCDSVRLEQVNPPDLERRLQSALVGSGVS